MEVDEDMYDASSLRPLYAPQSIAVIGASNNKLKFGGRPLDYMSKTGFTGAIYPVHPKDPEVQGLKAYRDVRDIGASIDLALIAVPARSVVSAAQACAEAGVRCAVVIASGFAESDPDAGAAWQAELTAIARDTGPRIVGPNCMGTASIHSGAVTTFATVFEIRNLRRGGIAMASQSGAMGAHVLVLASQRGLGVHSMVTTGNECDVDVAECIAYLADDPSASVIACYLEGCKRPDVLAAGLEAARRNRKPVVAIKVGATDVGAEAAETHTAALSGSDGVFDAVLKSYGVHRASSLDEVLRVASACSAGKYPPGRRLGIVTASGGGGVMAADAAVANGLSVPPLPQPAQDKLKAMMPFAAVRNPVDTTAQVSTQMDLLTLNLEVMLDEGGCDAIVLFLAYVALNPRIWEDLRNILLPFRERYPDALVVCTGMYRPDDARTLEDHGYLVVEDLTHGVAMVAVLERYARSFERQPERARSLSDLHPLSVDAGPLNEFEAARALDAAGIPMLDMRVAGSANEAAAAAAAFEGPVALKLLSSDIAHKSDIGGVRLGLDDADEVRRAYEAIVAAAGEAAPTDRTSTACWSRRWREREWRRSSAWRWIRCSGRRSCSVSAAFSPRSWRTSSYGRRRWI